MRNPAAAQSFLRVVCARGKAGRCCGRNTVNAYVPHTMSLPGPQAAVSASRSTRGCSNCSCCRWLSHLGCDLRGQGRCGARVRSSIVTRTLSTAGNERQRRCLCPPTTSLTTEICTCVRDVHVRASLLIYGIICRRRILLSLTPPHALQTTNTASSVIDRWSTTDQEARGSAACRA